MTSAARMVRPSWGYRSAAMHRAAGGPLPPARTIADLEAVACDPHPSLESRYLPCPTMFAFDVERVLLPGSLLDSLSLPDVPGACGVACSSVC